MLDLVFLVFLAIVVIIYVLVNKNRGLGWEIEGKDIKLSNETKAVSENILIYDGASMELDNSTITMRPSYHGEFGVYIEGDSDFLMSKSRIETEEYQYFVVANESEGKSPEIEVKDSVITGHAGISLSDRSSLTAKDSTLEELQMHDDSRAELKSTAVYPVFFSSKPERYENLTAGDSVTQKIESKEGWVLDLNNSEVWGYQVEVVEDSELEIYDSGDVVLSLHVLRDYKGDTPVKGLTSDAPGDGELDGLPVDVVWHNSVIRMLNLYTSGETFLEIDDTKLNEVIVIEDSDLILSNLTAYCNVCMVENTSSLRLQNVFIEVDEDTEPLLIISDDSEVEIESSDIRKLKIVLLGSASLKISDSQYDLSMIENKGEGTVILPE